MKFLRFGAALGGAWAVLAPGLGLAQSTPPPPFQFLRWQEDWSQWQPTPNADAIANLKHLDLGGDAWGSFGGDARARVESWSNFNFGAPVGVSHDDTFLLTRWRAHADLHAASGLRFFTEFKGAYASDRDLPGGIRAIDKDKFELQQAFLEFDLPALGTDTPWRLRAGRQLLAFGAQRLVSGLPWANALRTWDGARIDTTFAGWKLTAFGAAFVPPTDRGIGEADTNNQLYGVYATRPGPVNTDVYLLRNRWPPRTFNGSSGRDARWTLGTRVWGPLFKEGDYQVELTTQSGSVGPHAVAAWSLASQVGWKPFGTPSLRLWGGFDWASGDETAGGRVGTFNQLFPLGHAYFGIADVIGRQNIMDFSAGGTWRPRPALTVNATWHYFRADEPTDAIYNAGGGIVRPGGSYQSSEIGNELDLTAKWSLHRHLGLEAGWAHVFAGPALRESGPARDIDFTYVSIGTTF